MELSFFNINNGFTEGLVRGLRSGFLTPEDYRRVGAADNLEDVRSALEETDYGTFLQDENPPILVSTIAKKCHEKLADEFNFLKAQSVEPLTTFLDFIQREKMIDNVLMIIQCALNGKAPVEMEEKIHPMGTFESMRIIMTESFDVSSGFDEVYRIFLAETPIGGYFEEYLKQTEKTADDQPIAGIETSQVGSMLTNKDLEIMKSCLKKAWLQDFYAFVTGLGGTTAEVMGHILKVEADFRLISVICNALNTRLSEATSLEERNALYPSFGYLYPEGYKELLRAWNDTTVRTALEPFARYGQVFEDVKEFYSSEKSEKAMKGGVLTIEDIIYKQNVKEYEMAFEQQFHFGIFYAWVKLREQEIRNIRWVSNMVVLNTKDHIDDTIVPIFNPRT